MALDRRPRPGPPLGARDESRRDRVERELAKLTDDDAVELYLAAELGYPIPGGSGATDWDRLHAWERAILLRGRLVHEQRARDELVEGISSALLQVVGSLLGAPVTPAARPEEVPAEEAARRRLAADEEAARDREARAAALAGKIRSKGGSVPEPEEEHPGTRSAPPTSEDDGG